MDFLRGLAEPGPELEEFLLGGLELDGLDHEFLVDGGGVGVGLVSFELLLEGLNDVPHALVVLHEFLVAFFLLFDGVKAELGGDYLFGLLDVDHNIFS